MTTKKSTLLIGISAAAFLGPFTQTVYTPSLPELGTSFHVNTVLVNLTIALFTAIVAVSNFIVGPIADRWGRRATILPGMIIYVLGSVICLLSGSYGLFLAGRVIQAIGISTALVVAPTVIGDLYPPAERGQAMSVYQMVVFLGPVFGPVIGGLMAAYLHWQSAFALLAVAGVVAWLYLRAKMPETLPQGVTPVRISVALFRRVLGNRTAFAIIVLGFSQFYGYYAFLVFLPSLLISQFALTTSSAGFFFVPLTASMVAGVYVGSYLQKRWTRTRILGVCSFGIGVNVLLLWAALQAQIITIPLLVAFLIAYGLLQGCSTPVQSTILVSVFQKEKGTAIGIYNFFRFTGASIGPLIGGAIALMYGLNTVFLSLGVLLIISAWVVYRNLSEQNT